MCGIAGVLNVGYSANTNRFIESALITGMVRGMDSTGIMQSGKDGKIYFHKDPVEGLYFLSDKVTRQFVEDVPKANITVIHHRAATQGKINKANSHPFVVHKPNKEPLVGVHNGSLTAGWKYKEGADKFDVDSNWALSHIAKKGVDAFKDIYGPYCFVWAEGDKAGKLFMCRNRDRPMHILFSKDRKTLLFASEMGMLTWLAERSSIECEADVLYLTPERIYEFDTTGTQITYTSAALPRATYTAPPATTTTTTPRTGGTRTPIGGVTVTTPAGSTATSTTAATDPAALVGTGTSTGNLHNHGSRNKKHDDDVWSREAEMFIERVKLAVKGQDPYNTPAPAVTKPAVTTVDKVVADIVSAAEEEVITHQRTDDAPFQVDYEVDGVDLVPTTWFDGRNSKKAEREYATALGFFRELHWFSGVTMAEEGGSELLGDIEVWDTVNKVKHTYTGVIRNISQARAHADYINNRSGRVQEGGWVVVTGAYDDKHLGVVFVCSELNMIGKSVMADQRKKAN